MQTKSGQGEWQLVATHCIAILAAGAIVLGGASSVHAQTISSPERSIKSELTPLGKRGEVIGHARELVLQILESQNSCSEWFGETNSQAAEVFRSLHYQLEDNGPIYVYEMPDENGALWFKEPWAASTSQGTGRNSTVRLNGNGPFFMGASRVMRLSTSGYLVRFGGSFHLMVGSYSGNSDQGQVLALLHELGHILERLPEDNDSWDRRSSRNSAEVLSHCKREIRDVVRKGISRQ
jgi:hypothetical protein